MAVRLATPVASINGYPVKPGMYDELHLPSDEQLEEELAKLRERWTTPDQRLANAWRRANQHECRRCRGRGYRREEPQVRCIPCAGTGWIENR